MTDIQYNDKLIKLRALDPDHALLPMLSKGNGIANGIMLSNALQEIAAARMDGVEASYEEPHLSPTDDPTEDEQLRTLRGRQRQLYAERAQFSDQFHTATSQKQRAGISDDIAIVQRNIELTNKAIRHYKIHKSLPDEQGLKHYVPKDGAELKKKQASLRASISRKKKEVDGLEKQAVLSEAEERKLEKGIDKLTDLRAHLKRIDEAIKNL